MARLSALLAAFVSVSVVFASPIVEIRDTPITLPIAVRINATGSKNFVEMQRARAQQLIATGKQRAAARQGSNEKIKRAVINDPVSNQVVRSSPFDLTFRGSLS
jgi:cathepsin E